MTVVVRPGAVADAENLNQLYNWYVANSVITFDIEPWSLSKRLDWIANFNNNNNPHHLFVAEQNGGLCGYACNGQFRPKAAYGSSTEVTVYTDPNGVPRGTGSLLYSVLFDAIKATSLHRAYAIIALPNDTSIRLHKKFGFREVGTLDQVGTKFGKRINITWFEKTLDRS